VDEFLGAPFGDNEFSRGFDREKWCADV